MLMTLISTRRIKHAETLLTAFGCPGALITPHVVNLPGGKTAELQYKVIAEGAGPSSKSNDVVTVKYTGKLINGTEFDSSSRRAGSLKRPANAFVRGRSEALQLMKVGSKWELYIPSTLAYGDRAAGREIEPGSTLIFDMELVAVEPPSASNGTASMNAKQKAPSAPGRG